MPKISLVKPTAAARETLLLVSRYAPRPTYADTPSGHPQLPQARLYAAYRTHQHPPKPGSTPCTSERPCTGYVTVNKRARHFKLIRKVLTNHSYTPRPRSRLASPPGPPQPPSHASPSRRTSRGPLASTPPRERQRYRIGRGPQCRRRTRGGRGSTRN